jgi:hypothetical protein
MNQGAVTLGNCSVKQVGADRSRGRDAENQHQNGRHQRSAADASEPDQRAHDKTRQGIQRIERMERIGDRKHEMAPDYFTRYGCAIFPCTCWPRQLTGLKQKNSQTPISLFK